MSPLPVDIVVNGEKMGAITGMSVEARSSSGSILTLDLTYECGIVKIKTEYNIRKILGCMVKKIVYADATESENITMLPSAFSTVEKQEDGTYLLSGGGYGHGLGMSQNGANGMAKAGMGYQDILNYFYQDITVEMDGGPWFIPGGAVNELRREALDALLKKREVLRPWPTTEEHVPALPLRTLPSRRTLRARFENWEQVPERALDGIEYLILPIAQADRVPREWRAKTLLELPRVMFGKLEEDTARRIAATQDAGFAGYEVSNIAHLRLCRGLPMSGSFGLNITNQLAAQFYADNGLGSMLILPEVKDSDISTIAPTHNGRPVPTGVLVYGHMPLMITRACPLQNIHDCAHCDKTGVLTDRKAKKFPVRCGLGVRTIYNPVPIYMGDKPGALTVDYGVAYFTLESREEAAQILDMIRTHAPFEGDFTRGLYFKGTN